MTIGRRITWMAALAAQVGTVVALAAETRSEEGRTAPRITVYLYNYAQVPTAVLAEARQQVLRTYRAAGVETEWVDCPRVAEEYHKYPDCRPDNSRQDWVALRLISQSMIARLGLSSSSFGLAAVPEDGGFWNVAVVCSECVEQTLEGRRHRSGAVLGALMAHEMGHLLLSTVRHSAVGVMRSPWNRVDVQYAAQGRLGFTATEARRLRTQVRERMRHTARIAQVHESR